MNNNSAVMYYASTAGISYTTTLTWKNIKIYTQQNIEAWN